MSAPTHSGWWLRIFPDGRGYIGFGSSAFDGATLPAKTFEFAKVYRDLKGAAFPRGSTITSFAVTFVKDAPTNSAVYSNDERTIGKLFDKAYASVGRVVDKKRWDKIWRTRPRLLPETVELRKLQGSWKVVAFHANGKNDKRNLGVLWIFDGRKLYIGRKKPPVFTVAIDTDGLHKVISWAIPKLRLPKDWRDRPPLGPRGRLKKHELKDLRHFEEMLPKRVMMAYRLSSHKLILCCAIKTEKNRGAFRMRYVIPDSLQPGDDRLYMVLERVPAQR